MTPRVLLVDHFDSFTHNLSQALVALGAEVTVRRSDAVGALAGFSHLVLSPGPGRPEDAAGSLEALRACAGRIPVLGVCLGMQGMALAYGGRVERAPEPVHGKAWEVRHDGRGIFQGLPNPFQAARYHSLHVPRAAVPPELEVSAWTPEGVVMGLRHRSLALEGVQFHPESFLTPDGSRLLANFLQFPSSASRIPA